jgi:hypothetical protein
MSESKRATPPAELERLFMDPTRPKSEAEHWAVREIEKHKAEVERLRWALEVEGLRLAACDVVAMADTPESADRARQMQSGLRSAALSSVERRVDEVIALRAENERLRAERDALRSSAREFLTTLGAAMKTGKFHMNGSADMCHFVRQAMQKLDVLAFDREEKRPVGLERLHEEAKP